MPLSMGFTAAIPISICYTLRGKVAQVVRVTAAIPISICYTTTIEKSLRPNEVQGFFFEKNDCFMVKTG